MRKIKFFLVGLIPGLVIVFFVLNKKGVSCSGYLPNSRVIAETLSKDFSYTPTFSDQMKTYSVSESFLKDSIITLGYINFEKSKAQKKPCPEYQLIYPKENPKFEVSYEKCAEKVIFLELIKK